MQSSVVDLRRGLGAGAIWVPRPSGRWARTLLGFTGCFVMPRLTGTFQISCLFLVMTIPGLLNSCIFYVAPLR